jgi:NOL1/NOP2/sun family putative RNA methylase
MNLPDKYIETMKETLGAEFEAYMDSFQDTRVYGLRVNTLKISVEDFLKISPFHLTPIPWIPNGFYFAEDEKPAKHPYYFAGLYYLQEPSAMTPACMLPIDEGDCVLDMCAAPGGKSTELGAKLHGSGLLISNDISNSRAKALLKNVELFGLSNAFVINEDPKRLTGLYEGFFDKILIDAPCSGEGMFRKDNKLIKAWEKNGPQFYGAIQREIILYGADMLKPNGMMLYSTCTFSKYEDEETIQYLLEKRPEMQLVQMPFWYEGFSHGLDGLDSCVRIWPHKMKGEGHFLALLQKSDEGRTGYHPPLEPSKDRLADELTDFLKLVSMDIDPKRIYMFENRAYLIPEIAGDYSKIRKLRAGLLLGEVKKNRFEPSQAFAMALKMSEFQNTINLSADDPNVLKYLKGETIETAVSGNGWYLLCVDGYPLGWGKLGGTTLKNKYHAGWRWQ